MKLVNICSQCNASLRSSEYCASEDMYGLPVTDPDGRAILYVSICCGAEVLEDWREKDE